MINGELEISYIVGKTKLSRESVIKVIEAEHEFLIEQGIIEVENVSEQQ